nr:hypothetical protein CFP56_58105 [Quercus suber]
MTEDDNASTDERLWYASSPTHTVLQYRLVQAMTISRVLWWRYQASREEWRLSAASRLAVFGNCALDWQQVMPGIRGTCGGSPLGLQRRSSWL